MSAPEDVSLKIAFINLVEKHSCLWNYTLPSHSRVDMTSWAWREIAKELGDTEHNCRERWKNVRTAFGRSLKPPKSGSGKFKKPYYLASHMSFLIPYLKGAPRTEESSLQQTEDDEDSLEDNTVLQGGRETQESIDCGEMDDNYYKIEEVRWSDDMESETEQEKPLSKKKKLMTLKKEADEMVDMEKRREIWTNVHQQDSDWMFFQSMLPDFKKLDDRRKRTLKAKFLLLLNDQLDAFEKNS